MEKQLRNEHEAYQRILNGIISVHIGVASLPVEQLPEWEDFLKKWNLFQRESSDDIARMIRQFG